jgi:ectoine hydroxylase-related dioxygenase (phytanoyl-CoA dioxygenase family)
MKKNLDNYIKFLTSKGFVILEDMLKRKETKIIRSKLENILKKRVLNNENIGAKDSQVMYNYFYEDKSLLKLIYFPELDFILKKVLEPNYTLMSTCAQNRSSKILKSEEITDNFRVGSTWHTDSRYLNGKRLDSGFSYAVIIAIDAFTKFNGPTKFIENSFKRRDIPPRELKLKYKELLLKEGSICIMDTGMWHKGGDSTGNSRWSIFSNYAGWFVKPYHDFQDFILKNNIKKKYKKLLHFYSQPPKIKEIRNTVQNIDV